MRQNKTLTFPFTEPPLLPSHRMPVQAVCNLLLQPGLCCYRPRCSLWQEPPITLKETSTDFFSQTSGFPVQSSVTLHCSHPAGKWGQGGLKRAQVSLLLPNYRISFSFTHVIPAALPAVLPSATAWNTEKQSQQDILFCLVLLAHACGIYLYLQWLTFLMLAKLSKVV